MKTGLILALIGLALATPGAVTYGREFFAVDSCQDAGGSFDFTLAACDQEEPQPVRPFRARHPLQTSGAALGGAAVAAGLLQMRRRSRAGS